MSGFGGAQNEPAEDGGNIETRAVSSIITAPSLRCMDTQGKDGHRKSETYLHVAAGDVIFREGDPGDCAYLINSGKIDITVTRGKERIMLAQRNPGEMFGEMAIIDDTCRSATAVAVQASELLVITREQLIGRIEETDPIARLCLKLILERFRATLLRLQVLDHEDPVTSRAVFQTKSVSYSSLANTALKQLKLENELKQAIQYNQFTLHFQPIIHLQSKKLAGFESLIRWHHPQRGLMLPGIFMPTAETSGLIVPISQWILREALGAAIQFLGIAVPSNLFENRLCLGINLTARDFAHPNFLNSVRDALVTSGVDPSVITFEITETMLIDEPDHAAEILLACKNLGVKVSVDDFGTGFSSLSYLHRFPIDTLKIDRSFISRIGECKESYEIVRSIINLGKQLSIRTVAEGVETPMQEETLLALGVDFAQGFLYGRPVEAKLAEKLMRVPIVPSPVSSAFTVAAD